MRQTEITPESQAGPMGFRRWLRLGSSLPAIGFALWAIMEWNLGSPLLAGAALLASLAFFSLGAVLASCALRVGPRNPSLLSEDSSHSGVASPSDFENARDAIITLAPPYRQVASCNPASVALFNAAGEQELMRLGPWDLSPARQPDGRESAGKAREMVDAALRDGSLFFEWTYSRIRGDDFPATVWLTTLERGGQVILQAAIRDITRQTRVEKELSVERENLKAIIASSPVGMCLFNEDVRIVHANAVIERMVGRSPGQMIHESPGGAVGCVHSFEHEKGCGHSPFCPQCSLRQGILGVLKDGTSVHGAEMQASLLINGYEHKPWLRISAESVLLHGRKHVVVAMDDVTEHKKMEEELRSAACTDKLTSLPNRGLFCQRLEHAILRSRRLKQYHFAVLFLDFDRFKAVNDTLGHDVGDRLLQEMARRLRDAVRTGDGLSRVGSEHTAARLGGDEFVVLLDGISHVNDAAIVGNRLLEIFTKPYYLDGREVFMTASIGIATSAHPVASAEEMLRNADTAMYEAKLAGKSRCVSFDLAMRDRLQRRLNLELDLRRALEERQFFLMYQPIISLRTGETESFEALLRWRHPERGLIEPGEFVGIAEDNGLIVPIGEWVLEEACSQFARWRQRRPEAFPGSVSVNLSRKQLMNPDLPATIRKILSRTGMAPGSLHLEVTESAIMSNAAAATGILQDIKKIGVKLDMDDFGTGYSSLSCLHQFPIDVLKIDRSFVANINRGRDYAALVHAVTQLARNLNISVVAEGIENLDQAMVLQSLDCDFGQGYLFSKPLLAEDVPDFKVQRAVLPRESHAVAPSF